MNCVHVCDSGIAFQSQTDTEVIAQLIGSYLDQAMTLMDAITTSLSKLEGTWGLAIIHRDYPSQIIVCRHGSPLVIGVGENGCFVASEISAFSKHTIKYITLQENEIVVLNANKLSVCSTRIELSPHEHIDDLPAQYQHWTIKEIMEQPEAIFRTLNYGARFTSTGMIKLGGMESNKDILLSINHLVISGCGTSLYAGSYGQQLFQLMQCFHSVSICDAGEINSNTFPLYDAGLLVLSQSGETKDTHRALLLAQQVGIPTFSIVNQIGSLIARTTNCGIYLNAGREHAVASTKAFTTQVTALALLAAWYAQCKLGDSIHNSRHYRQMLLSISQLPIYLGMTLQCDKQIRSLASTLVDAQHIFVLGKGYGESIAREAALKLKEITYIHAEGYSGGALKHGPFALLCEGTPVIHIILSDQHAELMMIAAEETQARGAQNIIITDKISLADELANINNIIIIPSNGALTALLAIVPIQLLAYHISCMKGFNPDRPRNLAKSVTVD